MHAYIHTHTYVQTYAHSKYIHTHTYIHIYVHTYIHTYIHTHTHTHIYTYIRIYKSPFNVLVHLCTMWVWGGILQNKLSTINCGIIKWFLHADIQDSCSYYYSHEQQKLSRFLKIWSYNTAPCTLIKLSPKNWIVLKLANQIRISVVFFAYGLTFWEVTCHIDAMSLQCSKRCKDMCFKLGLISHRTYRTAYYYS